jgi:hypothetical protein
MDKFKVLWWLVRYLTRPELRPLGRSRGLVATLFDALGYGPAQVRFGVKYFLSRLGSSEYHHRVDDIRKLDADSGQQLAPVDAPEPRVPVEMPGLRFDPASATTTRQSDQR